MPALLQPETPAETAPGAGPVSAAAALDAPLAGPPSATVAQSHRATVPSQFQSRRSAEAASFSTKCRTLKGDRRDDMTQCHVAAQYEIRRRWAQGGTGTVFWRKTAD